MGADDFTKQFQDLATEYCWGAVWERDDLPLKMRSTLNLAVDSFRIARQTVAEPDQD